MADMSEKLAELLSKAFRPVYEGRPATTKDLADFLIANGVRLESSLEKKQATIEESERWIPVTERLPEPMQHIIAVGRNFPWLDRPGPVLDTFVYNPDAYQPWMEYITHWMPWPGFPKEVQ